MVEFDFTKPIQDSPRWANVTQGQVDYLDPETLARISGLELRARLVVEGLYSGIHHSPRHGLSVEFADHRAYTQGDDLRHIDWKVFGRTDKHYIKRFEQESNLCIMLAVDCSESMSYRSPQSGMSKHEYATTLAGSIAYLALQQRDAVGFALFDDQITKFVQPSNRSIQWKTVAEALSGQVGQKKTSIEFSLTELGERLATGKGRGAWRTMVILISDLFDDPERVVLGLRRLRYRRHEIIVWNLWDIAELEFPFNHLTVFDGLEHFGELFTEPGRLRERYVSEVAAFQERMHSECSKMQMDYAVFNTSASLGLALSRYLVSRATQLRKRSARAAK